MQTAGIICECNPFHGGHKRLIEAAKAAGNNTVICLMSGCFTERGEPALADPITRARALLRGGADAVLELPFPYAAAGAEFFAAAGVKILDRLGVDTLWFGSESGDMEQLSSLAEIAETVEFKQKYSECAAGNTGTARAYFDCLRAFGGKECKPNDILAVAYLRAIRTFGASVRPFLLKREGSGYAETEITHPAFPSATALRKILLEDGFNAAERFLLPETAESLRDAWNAGLAPAEWKRAESAVLSFFRLTPINGFADAAGLSGGLCGRMKAAAAQADSFEAFLRLCSTAKYPESRIRRGILFAMCGIGQNALRNDPEWVSLLAAGPSGRAFLSSVRRTSRIPVVTKISDLPDTPAAREEAEYARRAHALYTLCLPDTTAENVFFPYRKPYVD